MAIPQQHTATTEVEVIMAALVKPSQAADAPLIFGRVEDLREVAEHLYDFGLRHVPEEQRIWYHPPSAAAGMLEAGAGVWRDHPPGDAPPQTTGVQTLVAALTDEQRAELRAALKEEP